MASADHQIHLSAGLQASDQNPSESEIKSGESTPKQTPEDYQVVKVVSPLFCSQGVEDIFQSQAQVPPAEKKSDSDASEIQRAIDLLEGPHVGTSLLCVMFSTETKVQRGSRDERDIFQSHAPDRRFATEAKSRVSVIRIRDYDEIHQERAGASLRTEVQMGEVVHLGVNTSAGMTATVSKVCTVSSDGSQGGAYMVSGDPLSLSPTVSNFYFNKAVELPTRSTTRATKVITDPCKGSHVGTYTAVADVKLERSVAFPPTEVQEVEAVFLGVNMVSQLTFSRGGVALTVVTSHTAVVSTFNAAMTTKATADDPGKGSQGGTCTAEQKQCHSKAVVLSTLTLNAVLTTSKATADDQCKGSQGGTCTFGADVRGYQYISVWVSQHPPPNTGGAAPAWPPPLRLSNTREAARRNSTSTAVRAQIKAVPRLG